MNREYTTDSLSMEKELENHLLLFLDLSFLTILSLAPVRKGQRHAERGILQTKPVLLTANHVTMPDTKKKKVSSINEPTP